MYKLCRDTTLRSALFDSGLPQGWVQALRSGRPESNHRNNFLNFLGGFYYHFTNYNFRKILSFRISSFVFLLLSLNILPEGWNSMFCLNFSFLFWTYSWWNYSQIPIWQFCWGVFTCWWLWTRRVCYTDYMLCEPRLVQHHLTRCNHLIHKYTSYLI